MENQENQENQMLKNQIPNFITLINLLCGCLAMVFMFKGVYYGMFLCIVIAELADLFDGWVARLLNVQSKIGKELDSLADMVTFGVLPGIGMYQMLMWSGVVEWLALSGFLIALVSCYRLASFNALPPSDNFYGLATPSVTALTLGLLLTIHYDSFGLKNILLTPYLLFPLMFILSFLMLSKIPMFSLKFKSAAWKGNELKYIFIVTGVILIFLLKWASLPLGMSFYILLSVFFTKDS